MVIAVENGLDEVKNYLKKRGFSVVDLAHAQVFDAVVYQNLGFFSIPASTRPAAKSGLEQPGTFLVCARGKTPQEIETMLRQKSYGNLF